MGGINTAGIKTGLLAGEDEKLRNSTPAHAHDSLLGEDGIKTSSFGSAGESDEPQINHFAERRRKKKLSTTGTTSSMLSTLNKSTPGKRGGAVIKNSAETLYDSIRVRRRIKDLSDEEVEAVDPQELSVMESATTSEREYS